ncbi:LysR family transcriptional regulator [Cryobacterium sp. TMT1-21]|uniref:LysR family transcriptional regulator n=1 Tax=Cryobacterium shii TaxID=1259235 RepID=A0AAQ2C6G7_9MICO|nr:MULTISPECIES: LysR family transcriptional regulator [Cryobacterium]TFC47392.1 LysR family transcriptional regulator [Cryobacterium shii]TFC89301.1 LysR family transcriptional regulator [Cryobacterium sp. TmT2-59]TFD07409.1 LysR family transcriptional regulator [Cryobacterium sp. TMT1-21]TFD12479.1 LysR family transcriptional regulator [Cryobacterium sp. TMT4-10]TFD17464.1 LysR family transcriptional regulator [Cryobacterium sp. TMT2-23]
MDVQRLELLRELAERHSITEVARATHRTPSAVSQQLKVLEREAGLPLTERSGRGLILTDAGRALARSATNVAVALARATAVWDEFRNDATGEVSLVTFPTAGEMLLPGALREVAAVPGLVVNCTDKDPELSDFPALTAEFDIVLAYSLRGQLPWGGRGLTVVPLMTEPLDVGLPADHRLATRTWLTPADVVGETWIGAPHGYPFERILHQIEQKAGSPVIVAQQFADLRVIEAFVVAGLGIALVPRYTWGGDQPGRLVLKPLRGVDAERQIVALMRPDRAERLAVRTVVDVLRTEAARVQATHAAIAPAP